MAEAAPWVDVVRRDVRTDSEVIARKVSRYGQRTVTRVTTEITEQPYVVLSCGHAVRGADFDCRGQHRKRVRCSECAADRALEGWMGNGLNLTVRCRNALLTSGIRSIADLTSLTVNEVFRLPYVGQKMLTEIRDELRAHGLHLKGDQQADQESEAHGAG